MIRSIGEPLHAIILRCDVNHAMMTMISTDIVSIATRRLSNNGRSVHDYPPIFEWAS